MELSTLCNRTDDCEWKRLRHLWFTGAFTTISCIQRLFKDKFARVANSYSTTVIQAPMVEISGRPPLGPSFSALVAFNAEHTWVVGPGSDTTNLVFTHGSCLVYIHQC
jgi:hypothetical protein